MKYLSKQQQFILKWVAAIFLAVAPILGYVEKLSTGMKAFDLIGFILFSIYFSIILKQSTTESLDKLISELWILAILTEIPYAYLNDSECFSPVFLFFLGAIMWRCTKEKELYILTIITFIMGVMAPNAYGIYGFGIILICLFITSFLPFCLALILATISYATWTNQPYIFYGIFAALPLLSIALFRKLSFDTKEDVKWNYLYIYYVSLLIVSLILKYVID